MHSPLCCWNGAGPQEPDEVPPGQQKISFKPPQLDEEESESMTLPDAYRCDACAAIAYQIEAQCVASFCLPLLAGPEFLLPGVLQ